MSKFNNRLTEVDGIVFHSKREADRYVELKLNQQAGVISNLRCQVAYALDVNRIRIGLYKADFVYMENGREVTEDVKGMRTPVYQIKKRLMRAIYGIQILET